MFAKNRAPAEAVEYHAGDGLCLTHAPLRIKARLAGDDAEKVTLRLGRAVDDVRKRQQHPMMTP